MPLHTIHRPTILEEIIGNENSIASLKSVLNRESDVPHVYLFTGEAGCGKTSIGFILKDMLECSGVDFYYSSARKIDEIYEIINNCAFSPMDGKVKFILIEEAHRILGTGLDALLKFLEFIPSYVYFALCTSEPEKWPTKKYNALKRRCHHCVLKPLLLPQIKELLNTTLEKEGIADYPKEIINRIAEVCNGSPGQALNLLDTVIDVVDSDIALKAIEDATVSESNIAEIVQVLLAGNGKWSSIAKLIKGLSGDAESLRYAFLNYLNAVLLNKGTDRVAAIMMPFMENCMYSSRAGLTFAIYMAWCETKGGK